MPLPRPAHPSPEPAVVQDAWLADLIAGYEKGTVNPVSALHRFAQRYSMQLDFKETGVAGKYFFLYIQLCLCVLEMISVSWASTGATSTSYSFIFSCWLHSTHRSIFFPWWEVIAFLILVAACCPFGAVLL